MENELLNIEEIVETVDLSLVLDELIKVNAHFVNIEYLLIAILVSIGLCFGALCLLILSNYIRG